MVDIVSAIISGDLATVRTLLAQGTDPNTIGKDNLKLVHYAAMTNQPLVFSELVKYKANVNAGDSHNNQTLYFAARAGASQEFITQIVQAGGNLNNQNKIGQTATHVAARLGNVEALKALLKSGANPNIKDIVGKTPLMDVVKTNHPEEILLLKEYGASSTIKDNYNTTPLSEGLKSSNELIKDTFELPILEKIQIPNNALLQAVVSNHIVDVQGALAEGISANCTNQHGMSALHYAALHGASDIIATLSTAGAYLDLTNHDGMQAIHFAAMTHQISALDTLLKLGASVNAVDNAGNTPLHYAAQFTDDPVYIQKLLDAGAAINVVNHMGETPLHFALADGNVATVKFLVDHANEVVHETEAVVTKHAEVAIAARDTIEISDVLIGDDKLSALQNVSFHSIYTQAIEATVIHTDAIL